MNLNNLNPNSREASKHHCGFNNLILLLQKYSVTIKITPLIYTYFTSTKRDKEYIIKERRQKFENTLNENC